MNLVNFISNLFKSIRRLGAALVLGILLSVMSWCNVTENVAIAGTNSSSISDKAAAVADNIAAGTSKRIEGKAQKDIGTTQRAIGNISSEIEGDRKSVV